MTRPVPLTVITDKLRFRGSTPPRFIARSPQTGYTCLFGVGIATYVGEHVAPTIGLQIAVGSIFIFALLNSGVVSAAFSPFLTPLLAILVLGTVGTLFAFLNDSSRETIDAQRDILIVATHVLVMGFCYYLAIHSQADKVLVALWLFGVLTALAHLGTVAITLNSGLDSTLEQFRLDAGKGSLGEVTGLISIVLLSRLNANGVAAFARRRAVFYASIYIIIFSAVLSLSRTILLALIICAVSFIGLKYSDRRTRLVASGAGLARVFLFTIAGVTFVLTLAAVLLPELFQLIDNYFISKVANSFSEVASQSRGGAAAATQDYRSFETTTALRLYDGWGPLQAIFGGGYGTPVDFGFNTASSTATFTRYYAPFFHNGYIYFLIKFGLVGLLLYFTQIAIFLKISLQRFGVRDDDRRLLVTAHQALAAVSVILALGTVATGGFGFPEGYLPVAACIGVCIGVTRSSGAVSKTFVARTSNRNTRQIREQFCRPNSDFGVGAVLNDNKETES